ncbi:unnamed protein product [Thlaspi arvense]|uniref:Uncharacterized protein n=1 Tax=Thlaspi arvense TaxID=13288 RepID=A0AAU9SFF5_THLAR|nr:unnamed protein product [Thlaspi arvense]
MISEARSFVAEEESDGDMEETEEPKPKVEEEEEEEAIDESDVELEGDTVEPDNDLPQKIIRSKTSAFDFTSISRIIPLVLTQMGMHQWR